MKKRNKHPTPAKLPASIYDQMIDRLVWLHETEDLDDVSRDNLASRKMERMFTSGQEIQHITALLASTQAQSVAHAFMQILIVGSDLLLIGQELDGIMDMMRSSDPHAETLGKLKTKLRLFDAAQWSAIEVFRKHREAKPLLGIVDVYHVPSSPFSDAGDYREPKQSESPRIGVLAGR